MQQYNLVIFHTPRAQHISDYLTIRNMMFGRAPDIDVHIVSGDTALPADFWLRAAERPSLLFSPLPIEIDPAARGARVVSPSLSKLKEIELLANAGFPVPRTASITPDTVLDEELWGPYVVTKPNFGMNGAGISLVRTRDVRWVDPLSWPAEDPRHGKNMLAQQYVNTGPSLCCYRVFTVLGRAVYSNTWTATEPLPILDPDGAHPLAIDVAASRVSKKIELSYDAEVISLGERIHREFPNIPVMGLDIIRQHETGDLYVMEINSKGLTWHLSSSYGLSVQRKHKFGRYGQFNALKVMTEAFIEATRRMAV